MPELPEVETLKRELSRVLVGKKFKSLTSDKFALDIAGKKIISVTRRAKVLILELNGHTALLVHLKMTGQLIYAPANSAALVVGGHPQTGGLENLPNRFTRAVLTFTDRSQIFFNDLRKFGWLKLVDVDQARELFARVGPEPLVQAFTLSLFQTILARYPKRKIKQVLLDQTLIAGIGNIYADETCFYAKVRPMRVANSLSQPEQKDLFIGLRKILRLSIAKKGTSSRNYRRADGSVGGFAKYLKVYGRTGEKCKRCKTGMIKKIKQNGRGTHYCPECQK